MLHFLSESEFVLTTYQHDIYFYKVSENHILQNHNVLVPYSTIWKIYVDHYQKLSYHCNDMNIKITNSALCLCNGKVMEPTIVGI